MVAYHEAWVEFEPLKATLPLETPVLIAYKGPSSSAKRSSLDPETANHHYVDVTFTVLKDGHTSDIAVAGSDAPEALQHSVETAMKKARYRPRFENGTAVETKGVTMREQLLLRNKAPPKALEQSG
jgi:TonB family protein